MVSESLEVQSHGDSCASRLGEVQPRGSRCTVRVDLFTLLRQLGPK